MIITEAIDKINSLESPNELAKSRATTLMAALLFHTPKLLEALTTNGLREDPDGEGIIISIHTPNRAWYIDVYNDGEILLLIGTPGVSDDSVSYDIENMEELIETLKELYP